MILVSCCNHEGKLLDIDGNVIFNEESRGMAIWRDDLYVAMGYKPDGKERGLFAVDPISKKRTRVIEHGADLHGVFATKERIYCIDAQATELHWWDGSKTGKHKLEPYNANNHLNDIYVDGDDWWATCFHMGLLKNGEIICDKYQKYKPHSPTCKFGNWWYCASEKRKLVADYGEIELSGFTRGLLVEDGQIWVGVSGQRHKVFSNNSNEIHTAMVTRLDHQLNILKNIELPALEVYAICRI